MRISDWSSDVFSSDLPIASKLCSHSRSAVNSKCCIHKAPQQICSELKMLYSQSSHSRSAVNSKCCIHKTPTRSEEHTSELQSLMRISYAVFCLKKNKYKTTNSSYILHK